MGNKATLTAYTFAHFSVDFSCFFILYAAVVPGLPLAWASFGFLLYSTLAFGLQVLIGAWIDRFPRLPAAPLGCVLLLAALPLVAFPWPAIVLAGLGNAFFHVGGGVDALAGANGKMARSGVFVSSGALGVSFGTLAGRSAGTLLWLPIVFTVLSLAVCVLAQRQPLYKKPFYAFFSTPAAIPAGAVVALCLVSIIIRAYGGGIIPLPWRSTAWLGLLPGVAACLGKAAGGFLADRFGARTVGVATLLCSIPLLCFGNSLPATALLGLFLFNINMPITLCAIAGVLPESPGLSFGLTTLGLLLGTVPLYLFARQTTALASTIAVLTAVSALCLLLAAPGRQNLALRSKTSRSTPWGNFATPGEANGKAVQLSRKREQGE
ncbi:MAG: MFS transporter [Ruminococcaceae bacterium]|nr:MFS transporter [Oscillospiraceae bacterium]